ncbi:MAG: carbohydrate-binding domain-containing protein [Clostridiales bacterium]|nr:carbohydrate-binding domain-containing protein [Clostridiales bacterium]
MKLKKAISVFTTISIAGAACACNVTAEDTIKITVDGAQLECETSPYISAEGRTMVPLRAVFEALGAEVDWDDATKTVTSTNTGRSVALSVGASSIKVNGAQKALDKAAEIVNDFTMVPARAVAEALGAEVTWDEESKTVSITSRHTDDKTEDSGNTDWKNNTASIDLSSETVPEGVSIDEDRIEITDGGIYTISGTGTRQIYIDCEEKVKLILNGCTIKSETGPAIYVKDAKKLFTELAEGSQNYLEDAQQPDDLSLKGVIYSKDDMDIYGSGSLEIKGNYAHGIVSKETLGISSGTIKITAVSDGIHADDGIDITGANIEINAGEDGIQSEYYMNIEDGNIDITTTGAVDTSSQSQEMMRGGGIAAAAGQLGLDTSSDEFKNMTCEEFIKLAKTNEQTESSLSSKGIKSEATMTVSGGNITVNSTDHAVHSAEDMTISGGKLTLLSQYGKGISAHGYLTVEDGDITVEKSTEGMESKAVMTINGGDIDITASDDGINTGGSDSGQGANFGRDGGATLEMQIERYAAGEKLSKLTMGEIMEAMSGMENMRGQGGERPQMNGQPPEMNGGERPQMNGQPPEMNGREKPQMPQGEKNGRAPMQGGGKSNDHDLIINGGTIKINAEGDGIDSNGNITITGGYIVVNGPKSSGNGALDCGDGGYQIGITGGTLIAVGSAGMAEAPSEGASTQNTLNIMLSSAASALTPIKITDSEGNTILDFTPEKTYQSIVFSSADIKTGQTYTITAADMTETAQVSSVVTSIGSRTAGFGGKGGRGMQKNQQQ